MGREIVKTNIETKDKISGLGTNAQATFLGTGGASVTAGSMKKVVDISDKAPPAPAPAVPSVTGGALPPKANPSGAAGAKLPPSGNMTGSYAQASAAANMPSSGKGAYVSAAERDARMAADGGKLLYGMDKELADKQAAKWDPKLEAEVSEWPEA